MKKIGIVAIATVCLLFASCGNMAQMMSTKGLGNALKSVIGLDKLKAQNLIGTWNYSGPGCAFTSENLLAKAGGEVAAVQIEEKLLPYYQEVGVSTSNTTVTFTNDGRFSAKIAGAPINGSYTFDEATQKITLKTFLFSTHCFAKKEVGGIAILFESKKLLSLLQAISAFSNNKDIQTLGDLSKNYDGVRIGFDMKK